MPTSLRAGVARRTINPPIGTAKVGQRLYGDPIEAIQSNLTGTVCVVADADTTVAIVALDLCEMSPAGWTLDAEYHVPDLYVQAYMHPVALHPSSEQTVVQRLSDLIESIV